ncbi:hypothetical protein GJ496_006926 [Pomphorhynchus laevis]|nr:hypothetical protein GJ496_006926 [Pomphorhynchus laevis]
MHNYLNDTSNNANDVQDHSYVIGNSATPLNMHSIYPQTVTSAGNQVIESNEYYKVRPFEYKYTIIADRILHHGGANNHTSCVSPGFIDTTSNDDLLISEFSGDRVILCDRYLKLIKYYDMFKTSKNVFVVKNKNQFLCSHWHKTSLVDMETDDVIWNLNCPSPLNPWGITVLDGQSPDQIAVCFPSSEKICFYDTRTSAESHNPKLEWSFKNSTWINSRILPYTIAPNGIVAAGTDLGNGALIKCDVNSGKQTEVITSLNGFINLNDNTVIESNEAEYANNKITLLSSAMTDICQDCEGSTIVPDPPNSRVIIRDTAQNIHILTHATNIQRPCGVTLLKDGTLVMCDNLLNTIVMCTL